VLNEAVGLGPLEELLEDTSISEIMVNRFDEIYIERRGRLELYPLTFTGNRAVMGVIERIVAPLGRRIDESSPMVDARLKDGSRVNAIIPPLALKGACLTIRKFSTHTLEANDLIDFGSLNSEMADFLKLAVSSRKNIIVSGGTGSGKTTLLNILSNFIPTQERIITIEDAAELKLHHTHLVSLESRPANVEGKGAISIRDLLKNTLRMRPDRIVVGECRGAEALDMLQAMNTGHEGSLTTLHANSPRDALARLETMILMAGMELPLQAIREQIASAVDLIIQQTRFACGRRVITHIVEITGIESGKIQLQELFRFMHQGYQGEPPQTQGFFTGCDVIPHFYEALMDRNTPLDRNIFKPTYPESNRSLHHD
jgi:pilus assembly protein CpaF